MRGKVLNFSVADFPFGITPAYAGKSVFHFFQCPFDQGSPPPMRGKGPCQALRQHAHGITPAYAGKSGGTGGGRGLRWDHPRLCGEKRQQSQPLRQAWGSPPPMRGKVLQRSVRTLHSGITPAYAGKSGFRCFQKVLFLGSPPPMRGKGIKCLLGIFRIRITPAYAGKSIFYQIVK